MLIYTNIKINKIRFYHENVKKQKDIRSKEEYKMLKKDVKKKGILDPVVVESFSPDFLRMHVGEQRLLLAHELGIDKLKAFVYTKYETKKKPCIGRKINNVKQIKKYFRNTMIPSYKCLCDYIKSGIITLL